MVGISEKVMEALRAGILLNERLTTLIDKVNRMDQDTRRINDRLIRLETMAELAQAKSSQSLPEIAPIGNMLT